MVRRKLFACCLAFVLPACLLLASCESSFRPVPQPPEPDKAYVGVDVTPDWLESTWIVYRVPHSYDGAGDSLLVLDEAGEYRLSAPPVDGMFHNAITAPLQAEAVLGDTVTFDLRYLQLPWEQIAIAPGWGQWYATCPRDSGRILVCGRQDGAPRWTLLDHFGETIRDETVGGIGAYSGIVDFGDDGFLLGGHASEQCWLNRFDREGNEMWRRTLPDPELAGIGCLVRDGAGFAATALRALPTGPLATEVLRFDADGNVLASWTSAGDEHRLAADLARRPDGGLVLLEMRQAASFIYDAVLVDLDAELGEQGTRVIESSAVDFNCGLVLCTDGDLVVSILVPGVGTVPVDTRVVRLSASGFERWSVQLDGALYGDQCLQEEAADGTLLLCGQDRTAGNGGYRGRWTRLDPDGRVIATGEGIILGGGRAHWNAAYTAWDGGVIAAGSYQAQETGEYEPWTVHSQEGFW